MFAAFRPEGRKARVLAPTQQGQFKAQKGIVMNRRELLKSGAACAAASMLPNFAFAATNTFAPQPSDGRRFELTTSVAPAAAKEVVRFWVPLAEFFCADLFRPVGNCFSTNARVAWLYPDAARVHGR